MEDEGGMKRESVVASILAAGETRQYKSQLLAHALAEDAMRLPGQVNPVILMNAAMMVHELYPGAEVKSDRSGLLDFYPAGVDGSIPCASLDLWSGKITIIEGDTKISTRYPPRSAVF